MSNSESASITFLLQELSSLEAERLRLKGEASQRLNFFLSLTTATLGGLVAFGQLSAIYVQGPILIALAFLAVIGWQTFSYIITREISSDFTIRAIARIRRYFTNKDPELRTYLTWRDYDSPTRYITHNRSSIKRTAQFITAFLALVFIGDTFYILDLGLLLTFSAATVVFIVVYRLLTRYAQGRFREAVERAHTQAIHPKVDRLPSKRYLTSSMDGMPQRNREGNDLLTALLKEKALDAHKSI